MKIINMIVPSKFHKDLMKEADEFRKLNKFKIGRGCVASVYVYSGIMKVAFMHPKEFRVFEAAYKKGLKALNIKTSKKVRSRKDGR